MNIEKHQFLLKNIIFISYIETVFFFKKIDKIFPENVNVSMKCVYYITTIKDFHIIVAFLFIYLNISFLQFRLF